MPATFTYLKNKLMILKIEYYVFEEGNLDHIKTINGYYKLAEYCVKTNRIDDFKQFVDHHRDSFKHFKQCHIIMPQFRELYTYAYSKTKYSSKKKKN